MLKSLVLLATCFAFLGCASTGGKFQEAKLTDKKKAQLNVYRVQKFAGSAGSPYLCLDGKVIGELVNGAYLTREIEPGEHVLMRKMLGANAGDVKFTANAGESYYLRSDYSMDNGAKENAEIGRTAALGPGGGGALGAGMTAAFFGSKAQQKKLLESADKRTKSAALNPGFFFVTPEVGLTEISETNEFKAPEYKTNPCENKPAAPPKEDKMKNSI